MEEKKFILLLSFWGETKNNKTNWNRDLYPQKKGRFFLGGIDNDGDDTVIINWVLNLIE